MCTVLLPPGGYPIVVNKYIMSYHIKGSVRDTAPICTKFGLGLQLFVKNSISLMNLGLAYNCL